MAHEEFNDEPVVYCTNCLSLRIQRIDGSDEECMCGHCGSTETKETDINTWKDLYKQRYGHNFIEYGRE